MLINNNDSKNRIIRLLIFLFLSFIFLRFVYDLDTNNIMVIILSQAVIFMFIDLYYPSVSISYNDNNTNNEIY